MTPDAPDVAFAWPDVRGRRALVVGLGGGADAVTAYAVARALDPDGAALYGNAKTRAEPDLVALSAHVYRVPGEPRPLAGRVAQGSTTIDRALPRGPLGCPLVFVLERRADPAVMAAEVAALGADLLVGVDTGGDVLETGPRALGGRDQRMLAVLRATGLPTLTLVVGPGADGQLPAPRLERYFREHLAAGRYRGRFALDALRGVFEAYGPGMAAERTTNVILRALAGGDDPVAVPRGCRPSVPRAWLTSGYAFEL